MPSPLSPSRLTIRVGIPNIDVMNGRVSENGQVTIPKGIRDQLGIRAGALLDFDEEEGRIVATKVQEGDPLEEVFGVVELKETTDEFGAAIRGEPETV